MSEEKYKLSRLITYLYETMNGELAKDYAELDSENIELLLKELEEKDKEIERLNKENEELKKIQCTFLGTGCKAEIERLNNIIDKKEQFLGDNIKRLEREVVKRDNIINELEKYLIEQVEKSYSNDYDNVLDKLDELKGSDKE